MAGTKRMGGMLAVVGTLALLAIGMGAHAADEAAGRIERVELEAGESSTRVVIMLSRPRPYDVKVLAGDAAKESARRLVLDFANTTLAPAATQPIAVTSDLLRQIRTGQFDAHTARIVLDLASDTTHSVAASESPPRVTIALAGATTVGTTPTGAADAPPPAPPPPPATTAASEAPKPPADTAARKIPIRALGRRPFSLLNAR